MGFIKTSKHNYTLLFRRKDGVWIDPSQVNVKMIHKKSERMYSMVLSNLTRWDSGHYIFKADNDGNNRISTCYLVVHCKPQFRMLMSDAKASVGDENIEFTVILGSAPGVPKLDSFTWYVGLHNKIACSTLRKQQRKLITVTHKM